MTVTTIQAGGASSYTLLTNSCLIECIGAGGAGGPGAGGMGNEGGGGGGGGASTFYTYSGSAGDILYVSVGIGGSGNGNATIVGDDSMLTMVICRADGGAVGTMGTTSGGGAGGHGGAIINGIGDTKYSGGTGGNGTSTEGGGGGGASDGVNGNSGSGITGGSGSGTNGGAGANGTTLNGVTGSVYGGGGSGGAAAGSVGNGANGLIVFTDPPPITSTTLYLDITPNAQEYSSSVSGWSLQYYTSSINGLYLSLSPGSAQQTLAQGTGTFLTTGNSISLFNGEFASDFLQSQTVASGNWTFSWASDCTNATSTVVWEPYAVLYLINGSNSTVRTTIFALGLPTGCATGRTSTGETTVYSTTVSGSSFSATAGDFLSLEVGSYVTNTSGSTVTPALDLYIDGTSAISSDNTSTSNAKSLIIAPAGLLFAFQDSADISCTVTVSAAGICTVPGIANLSCSVVTSESGKVLHSAAANLSCTSSIPGNAFAVGFVNMSCVSSVSATGKVLHSATVSLHCGSTIFGSGVVVQLADVQLSCISAVIAGTVNNIQPNIFSVLSNRMWPEMWVPGINEFDEQAVGLVFAMPLQERSGTIAGELFGRNNGKLNGNANFVLDNKQGGFFGNCLSLNDSSAYVYIKASTTSGAGNNLDLSLPQYQHGFTISFWFYGIYPTNSGAQCLFSNFQTSTDTGFYITMNTGTTPYIDIEYYLNNSDIPVECHGVYTWPSFSAMENKWWHVAFVLDYIPSSNTWQSFIYLNAQLLGGGTNSSFQGVFAQGGDLVIGNNVNGGVVTQPGYPTYYKDFRIYKEQLTAGAIERLYNFPDELYAQPFHLFLPNVVTDTANLHCISSVTASGTRLFIGNTRLVCNSTIVAFGTIIHGESSHLNNITLLYSFSNVEWSANSDLSCVSSVFSSGKSGNISYINCNSIVSATGKVLHKAAAVLGSISALNPIGKGTYSSSVNLQSISSVEATGLTFIPTPIYQKSIELWFQPGLDVISKQSLYEEGNSEHGFGIYLTSNIVVVIAWNTVSDGFTPPWGVQFIYSSPVILPNIKHHVALTFSAIGNVLVGYLDGSPFGVHVGGLNVVGAHTGISVGAQINDTRYSDGPAFGDGARFKGVIDEVLIYTYYLGPSDVFFNYESSLPTAYDTFNFALTGSGGLVLGGSGNPLSVYPYSATGGLVIGGGQGLGYTASGGLVVGGSSFAGMTPIIYTASGGLVVGGSGIGTEFFAYTGSGGLVVGGTSGVQNLINITQTFTWNINQYITIDETFTWNIIQGKLQFYNIITSCQPQTCPPLQNNGATCQSRQVITLVATSLSDVCTKLKQAGITANITSIKRYSNPVFLSDFTPQDNINCNILEDVTSEFNCS